MRGSQSISDLSNIHDNTFSGGHLQDRPNSSAAHGPRGNKVKQALTVDHSPLTGSKRNQACTTSKNVSASSTVNNGTLPITNHYVVCAVAGSEPRLTIFFPHMSLVWCLVICMINYINCLVSKAYKHNFNSFNCLQGCSKVGINMNCCPIVVS